MSDKKYYETNMRYLCECHSITLEELRLTLNMSKLQFYSFWSKALHAIAEYFEIPFDEFMFTDLQLPKSYRYLSVPNQKELIVDFLSVILIILPLYPKPVNGHIYAVNLFDYEELKLANRIIYWFLFLLLVLVGAIKIFITQYNLEKVQSIVTYCSMFFSVLTVLFLTMTREPYAVTMVFVLLIIKVILFLKITKQ